MNRGRLLDVDEVLARWFTRPDGTVRVSRRWALRNLPRVDIARGVVGFYEADIDAWLDGRRRAA